MVTIVPFSLSDSSLGLLHLMFVVILNIKLIHDGQYEYVYDCMGEI